MEGRKPFTGPFAVTVIAEMFDIQCDVMAIRAFVRVTRKIICFQFVSRFEAISQRDRFHMIANIRRKFVAKHFRRKLLSTLEVEVSR